MQINNVTLYGRITKEYIKDDIVYKILDITTDIETAVPVILLDNKVTHNNNIGDYIYIECALDSIIESGLTKLIYVPLNKIEDSPIKRTSINLSGRIVDLYKTHSRTLLLLSLVVPNDAETVKQINISCLCTDPAIYSTFKKNKRITLGAMPYKDTNTNQKKYIVSLNIINLY